MKKYSLHFGAFGKAGVIIADERTGLSNYASRNGHTKRVTYDKTPTEKDRKEVAKLLKSIGA